MRWRDYLAVVVGLVLIRKLRTIWAPSTLVVLAVLLAIVLGSAVIRRMLRRRRYERLAALDAEVLEAAIGELPDREAALARLDFGVTFRPENLEQIPVSRRFAYRSGSRSLHTFVFWLCIAMSAGIAVPVAFQPLGPADGLYVWLGLAGFLGLCAWGYWQLSMELGASLLVDSQGIALEGTPKQDVRIGWLEVAWIRSMTLPGETYRGIIIGSSQGKRIVVDSQMPEFELALEMIAGKLVATRGTD